MNIRTLLLQIILFFLVFNPIQSQEKSVKAKYGKVSKEELNMRSLDSDPSAPAVVLFDKGIVHHRHNDNNGFTIIFDHHKRIKIFKKEGYVLGDLAIFYNKGQKVQDLKATCYNLTNGSTEEIQLSSSNVFDEKLTSDYFVKKAAIPGIKEGSIVEYKYTIVDDGIGLPLSSWAFQDPIAPTLWSEFEASIPAFIEYKKFAQGWTPFLLAEETVKNESTMISYLQTDFETRSNINSAKSVRLEYSTNVMHYIQENVPALKIEPFVASARDYISKISFDVNAIYKTSVVESGNGFKLVNVSPTYRNRTWNSFGKDLLKDHFEDPLSSSKYTSSETAKCIESKVTNLEKATAIYTFIGKNYEPYSLRFFWQSQTLEQLTKNRKGSNSDINMLFINMLRRAKLNAYPVLISTRPHGRVVSHRVSAQTFDRIVTAVELDENGLTLIDASSWPHPIGLLPTIDVNGEGLLLKSESEIDWIALQQKNIDRSAFVGDFVLLADGTLTGKITFSETGHGATEARQKIASESKEAFLNERFKNLASAGQISNIQIDGITDWNSHNLKGSFELVLEHFSTANGNKIYLNPLLGFGLTDNPFKNPDRKFGIDFGPNVSEVLSFTYQLPEGYSVEEVPKPTKIAFGENQLSFEYAIDTNNPTQLKFSSKQFTKTPFIPVEMFSDLQQYYALMVAKMAEQAVLTKG